MFIRKQNLSPNEDITSVCMFVHTTGHFSQSVFWGFFLYTIDWRNGPFKSTQALTKTHPMSYFLCLRIASGLQVSFYHSQLPKITNVKQVEKLHRIYRGEIVPSQYHTSLMDFHLMVCAPHMSLKSHLVWSENC